MPETKTLEKLLAEAFSICYHQRCTTCEFYGRIDPNVRVKKCQSIMIGRYLREHGVEVRNAAD